MFMPTMNPSSSFVLPKNPTTGLITYGNSTFRSQAAPDNFDMRLEAGPGTYAATQVKNQIAARNERMQQNRSAFYQNDPWAFRQGGRPQSPVANAKAKAMSYYFEGQRGDSSAGPKAWFSMDPNAWYTGNVDSEMIQKFKSIDWKMQDPSLTNLPPGYHLTFGNKIVGPDKGNAEFFTKLRSFGALGDLGRDTAAGQLGMFIASTAQERAAQKAAELAASIPKEHWQPISGGQYQLGNMQGQRERAWMRREQERYVEDQKSKLKAAGPGNRVQQAASVVEKASTR